MDKANKHFDKKINNGLKKAAEDSIVQQTLTRDRHKAAERADHWKKNPLKLGKNDSMPLFI